MAINQKLKQTNDKNMASLNYVFNFVFSLSGMSWDYKSGHLYWSEMNPDAIFVMNPDSPATEFVLLASENHNLSDPRAILVLPHERWVCQTLYFILYSENQCKAKLDKIGIFIDMKFH